MEFGLQRSFPIEILRQAPDDCTLWILPCPFAVLSTIAAERRPPSMIPRGIKNREVGFKVVSHQKRMKKRPTHENIAPRTEIANIFKQHSTRPGVVSILFTTIDRPMKDRMRAPVTV
jgi:hypothetical protein